MKREFDQDMALKVGKALTRDGRIVKCLERIKKNDGHILIGLITRFPPPYKAGLIPSTGCWWHDGGLGLSGDDDLVE